mgnify:CR=1 FL=1
MLPRISRAAAASTRMLTKRPASASAAGCPPRATSRPTSTASDPATASALRRQGRESEALALVTAFPTEMVTADELAGFDNLALQTRVNGDLRQDDKTTNMIFGLQDLIEYISSFTTLKVGDLISTGTPTGAGARFDPPRYLKPGDVVEITSPTIGTLRNGVIDG